MAAQVTAPFAQAFYDIEHMVGLARSSAVVAELVLDEIGGPRDSRTLVLTDKQYTALDYAVRRAREEADVLHREYYERFEAAESAHDLEQVQERQDRIRNLQATLGALQTMSPLT